METSHIVIILIVLAIIAAVTYFVFLKKKDGDGTGESPSPSFIPSPSPSFIPSQYPFIPSPSPSFIPSQYPFIPSPSSFVPSPSSFVPSPSSFVPSSPRESLLETVLKQTSADTSITQSSFYNLGDDSPSPSSAFVISSEQIYTPHEIISRANDSNTTIEYVDEHDELNFFEKYDDIFQDTINALFELSGCEKGSGIPLSRLLKLQVTIKLSNEQKFYIPFMFLLINTALKNQIIDNKQIDDRVTDFITSFLFLSGSSRGEQLVIYNERTKQVTFKDGRKPDNLTKNTISLDEFRDFLLKKMWIDYASYFNTMIKTHKYLDNYPVCRVFTL